MSTILTNIGDIVTPAAESYLLNNQDVFRGNAGPTGATGAAGAAGQERYTWIRYADSDVGVGLSDNTENKDYIGIAVNKTTPTESNVAGDYQWALIRGADGAQGIQGSKGNKGDTGTSVHHTKGTHTTDPEGDFSTSGELDTYTMYGDADETIVLGWFTVKNGDSAYSTAVAGGYVGTEEAFQAELSGLSQLVIDVSDAVTVANDAAAAVADKLSTADLTSSLISTSEVLALTALGGKTLKDQMTALTLDNIAETATKKHYAPADVTKLAGIEAGATADQTNAEIKVAYEANTDTNAYTDAEKTKLAGVEAGATGDLTALEIATLYESRANTNKYTDAEQAKLAGIEDGAKGDQVASEVPVTPVGNLSSTTVQAALQELQGDVNLLATIKEW